jgi:hypothetical protein
MQNSPLSIFSFETLRLGARPAGLFAAPLIALALLLLAEGGARLLLANQDRSWEYWDASAADKFEGYRREALAGAPPDVLVVGDSSAARDIDPGALLSGLPAGMRAYNLGWPANFPVAFRCTTLPLLAAGYAAPKLVVASLSVKSFVDDPRGLRLEEGVLSSYFCRRQNGELSLSDRIYLTRLRHFLSFLFPLRPEEILADGFMPLREPKKAAGAARAPREPAGRQPAAAAEAQTEEGALGLAPERLEVIYELGRLARARGFALIVVIPPRWGLAAGSPLDRLTADYREALEEAAGELGFTVLDMSRAPFLSEEHFYDGGHLLAEGAAVFSKEIAKTAAALLTP